MHSHSTRNMIWLGLGEGFGRLSVFAIFVIASKLLDPPNLADYLVLFSLSGLAWTVAQMGTGMYGVRALCNSSIDTTSARILLGDLTFIRFVLAMTVISISWYFCKLIVSNDFLISMTMIIVVFKSVTLDWALRAYNLTKYLGILMIVAALISIPLSYLFLKIDPSALSVFIAHSSAGLILFIGTWLTLGRTLKILPTLNNLNIGRSLSLLPKTSLIGLAGVSAIASQSIPLVALSVIGEPEEVAIFGGIQRILQLALGILFVLSLSHFPQLSRSVRNPKYLMGSFQHYLADLFLTSLCIYALLGSTVNLTLDVVLGPSYSGGEFLYLIMLALIPIYFIRTAFTDTLIAAGKSKAVLWACILGLIISIVISCGILPMVVADQRVYVAFWAVAAAEITVITCAIVSMNTYLEGNLIFGIKSRIILSIIAYFLVVNVFINEYRTGLSEWLYWGSGGGLFVVALLMWTSYSSLGLALKFKGGTTEP